MTETGTTERISPMRDFGGEEMLPKFALAVWFAVMCSLCWVRYVRVGSCFVGDVQCAGDGAEIDPIVSGISTMLVPSTGGCEEK